MSVKIICPSCGKKYDAPDEYLGKKFQCHCGAVVEVPVPEKPPAEKPPVPVPAEKPPVRVERKTAEPERKTPEPRGVRKASVPAPAKPSAQKPSVPAKTQNAPSEKPSAHAENSVNAVPAGNPAAQTNFYDILAAICVSVGFIAFACSVAVIVMSILSWRFGYRYDEDVEKLLSVPAAVIWSVAPFGFAALFRIAATVLRHFGETRFF